VGKVFKTIRPFVLSLYHQSKNCTKKEPICIPHNALSPNARNNMAGAFLGSLLEKHSVEVKKTLF